MEYAKEKSASRSLPAWLPTALLAAMLVTVSAPRASAIPLVTYLTGDTPADGQVVFQVVFDSAVADSASLSIVASESTPGLRLDNIDFVPGSNFKEVVVTAQSTSPVDGALTRYNVQTGAELTNVIGSTNLAGGVTSSRPASIVPNPSGTHYYYTENQFGFAGSDHRMMRVPIGGGATEVVYDGSADDLVEFSGVEIVGGRMYFFAHDTTGPADERQLYSVALGGGGLAVGAPDLRIAGLDRSGSGGATPGSSDGSDELDFDPSTGLIYGTNIGTGQVIGVAPGLGTVPIGSLPFHISEALVTASASVSTDTGLGLLSGVATPGAAGPLRQIDGIRPDGAGHLVVIGHNGVIVSIDIGGVLGDGADNGDIIRLFNRDVPTAGFTLDFDRAGVMFDDHTILAPASILIIPEPSTVGLTVVGCLVFPTYRRRKINTRH